MKFAISRSVILIFSLTFPFLASADLKTDAKMNFLVALAKEGESQRFVDIVKQEQLLTRGDSDGHTALFAAMFGEPKLTDRLLALGASLEQRDAMGYTPLISAALLGYPEAADSFIKKGANIEAKNADGQTALLMSVLSMSANEAQVSSPDKGENKWHHRWDKVIDLLVKNGANVNTVDNRGATPLFIAIFSNNEELCRYLIGIGADPNHKLKNGVSLLRFAKVGAAKSIVKLLEENGAK